MRLLFKTANVAVYDDVLSKEDFQKVWLYIQQENYSKPSASGTWLKVWRTGDAEPLGTRAYWASDAPFMTPLSLVHEKCQELGKNHPEIVKPFADTTYRSYIYPRGVKLSWHDDSDVYMGAMTFYAHQKWGSTWGGELMVAQVPPINSVFKDGIPNGPHLDHDWEDQYINLYAMGTYINPKPNRMVIMAPGTYHAINRVDADAGDHARCSVVGFYLKDVEKNKF